MAGAIRRSHSGAQNALRSDFRGFDVTFHMLRRHCLSRFTPCGAFTLTSELLSVSSPPSKHLRNRPAAAKRRSPPPNPRARLRLDHLADKALEFLSPSPTL